MSSYIVDDETINKFLTVIMAKDTDEWRTKFGRKLLAMNIKATEQRYSSNPFLNKVEKKERLKNFEFSYFFVSRVQALKSLSCFLYQCAEGNVPNSKLFKEMRLEEEKLMWGIIDALPEYSKAKWG